MEVLRAPEDTNVDILCRDVAVDDARNDDLLASAATHLLTNGETRMVIATVGMAMPYATLLSIGPVEPRAGDVTSWPPYR